jgi:hypothetical protein
MTSRRIAFSCVATAALSCSDQLVRRWLPDGRREGAEWVAINPTRRDGRTGSFKVNLKKWPVVRFRHRRQRPRPDCFGGLPVPPEPGRGGD